MRAKAKEVKIMQGTFKPSRANLDGLEFELLERNPSVPDGWPLPAQIIWRDVCTWLKSVGYLCKAYVPLIEEYSWAYYRCQVAREKLITEPDSTRWEKIMDNNSKKMERLTTKFGFSPMDSQKIMPRVEIDSEAYALFK